jgi:hypothetical protein
MTIQTTGAVAVQRSGSSIGRINVSGDAVGGTISIQAGGAVNISGDLHADKLSSLASGGSIVIVATGDLITTSTSAISAIGSKLGSGTIDFSAGGRVDLGATIDVSGDEGGSFDVDAGADAVVRRVRGDGIGRRRERRRHDRPRRHAASSSSTRSRSPAARPSTARSAAAAARSTSKRTSATSPSRRTS